MSNIYLQVYDALRYQWEPGREVRQRLMDEHHMPLSSPVFYQIIATLHNDYNLAELKYVEVEIEGKRIRQPNVRKFSWGIKAQEKLGSVQGLEGILVLS